MGSPHDIPSPVVSRLTVSPLSETRDGASRLVGYARAWRDADDLAAQRVQLQSAGCSALFGDEAKGSATFRQGLDAAIGALSAGDCLAVVSLARLAWRESELRTVILAVQARNAHLRSIAEDFDTRSPSSIFRTISALEAFADATRRDREREALAGVDGRAKSVPAMSLAKAIASVEDGSAGIREWNDKDGVVHKELQLAVSGKYPGQGVFADMEAYEAYEAERLRRKAERKSA